MVVLLAASAVAALWQWRLRGIGHLFQFSLSELLVLTAVVAPILGFLVPYALEERKETATASEIEMAGAEVDWEYIGPKCLRRPVRLLGIDIFDRASSVCIGSSAMEHDADHVLGDVIPKMKCLPSCRRLDLTWSTISDDGLEQLAAIPRLESLSLNYTEVGDSGVGHLLAVSGLRSLDLAGTEVSDAGLAIIAELPYLNELRLEGNFTDIGLAHLESMKNLRHLRVSAKVTEQGVARLRDKIPGLQVEVEGDFIRHPSSTDARDKSEREDGTEAEDSPSFF